jgi:ParB-like chromosome segregation protein Spo0J
MTTTHPANNTANTANSTGTNAAPQPQEYEFHPIANIFPMMEGAEFRRFKEDIRTRKQQEPIIIHEGKILDGRNRYKACKELKLTPATKAYDGTDPVAFVLSANLHRRHLTESQRGMVAAKLASLSVGANQHTKEGLSIERASKLSTASVATANRCKKVLNDGVPELAQMVERGQVAASLAEEVAKLPKDKQAELVKTKELSAFKKAAKQATTEAQGEKTSEELSDEIEKLVDALIDKLKEIRARNADNASADVADLIRRLQEANLWTEPKKKAA